MDTTRVYRTGRATRWHFVEPVAHRPGTRFVTACSAAPVRQLREVLTPDAVPAADRCRGKGCRQHWPDALQIPAQQNREETDHDRHPRGEGAGAAVVRELPVPARTRPE